MLHCHFKDPCHCHYNVKVSCPCHCQFKDSCHCHHYQITVTIIINITGFVTLKLIVTVTADNKAHGKFRSEFLDIISSSLPLRVKMWRCSYGNIPRGISSRSSSNITNSNRLFILILVNRRNLKSQRWKLPYFSIVCRIIRRIATKICLKNVGYAVVSWWR